MANVLRNEPCKRCRGMGNDKSGNNLVVYDNESSHCFACGYTILSEDYKREHGIGEFENELNKEWEFVASDFSVDDWTSLKEVTSLDGKGYRGISKKTYTKYGVRHEFDTNSGEVVRQYYPVSKDGKFSGVKVREHPKTFYAEGTVGKTADLFGQAIFKTSVSKTVLLCAGEIDTLSAYEMLSEYSESKGFDATPVVCTTIGEGGVSQVQAQYAWLDKFDKIVLCYDSDDAGQKAMEKTIKVLPKGKVFVMELPVKDVNIMLEKGMKRDFINRFFRAKAPVPAGVVGSGSCYDAMLEESRIPKMPLPPFLKVLQKAMAGGIPLGRIVNLIAKTSIGKTTYINEMIYYWVYNSPHKIGVVTLELDVAQYGNSMLSRHIGRKIDLIEDATEKEAFLTSPEVVIAKDNLFYNDDGSHRWYLLDDRDGTLEEVQRVIEELIISCDCKVIVLDPLSDLLDGLTNDEQAMFAKWQKRMIKSHRCTFINIVHTRKQQGTGQQTDEDASGSSTIVKSGAANIFFSRDKLAEDEIEKNTTSIHSTKIRWTGKTGDMGKCYYDNATHTLYDLEDWLEANGGRF